MCVLIYTGDKMILSRCLILLGCCLEKKGHTMESQMISSSSYCVHDHDYDFYCDFGFDYDCDLNL